ncbi:MAG: hypothetical protein ACRC33_29005 [Gemmataceae bacterium]
MHDRYAKDGFEVIAVATDKASDAKGLARAREFLRDKLKVKFLTAHVDGTTFDYEKKINTLGVPAAFVFDRDNRWVQRLPSFDDKGEVKDEVDYDLIEKAVAGLMKRGEK